MRIVFAGTPAYAVPSLRALAGLKPRHTLVAVVTQPDRPKRRSKSPTPPPLKAAALDLGVPPERIFQPLSINHPETLKALRGLRPDLLCVAAYGGLLKEEALALPKRFALNAHGSLLPKFRGAAPIAAAILAGERETGVCIMRMVPQLDAGPVLLRRRVPVSPRESAGTLHDKLAACSAECFLEALRRIEAGGAGGADEIRFTPQDESQASYAPKLTKASGRLDWTKSAAYLERFVRAMTPWPGAWSTFVPRQGAPPRRLRVLTARLPVPASAPTPAPDLRAPGQAWFAGEDGAPGEGDAVSCMAVRCGDGGLLCLSAVQLEGKRALRVPEFFHGAGRALVRGFRLD